MRDSIVTTPTTAAGVPHVCTEGADLGLLRMPTAAARRLGAAGVAAQAHAGARLAACAIGLCGRRGADVGLTRPAGQTLAASATAGASRSAAHDDAHVVGDLLAA